MGRVELAVMTRAQCHALYRGWQNDPALYPDAAEYRPYVYDTAAVDRYFDARQTPDRVLFAVLLEGQPIGEVQLKAIDRDRRECTLSIHLQNDAVKGQGYGTQAERLAVRYAFDQLGMRAVKADAVITNTRSQHVLEKVGFRLVGEENGFRYYRVER
ncbi:MAG: GNAT family N-acetyltransferase [Clostridia bacterium]|nr:GNAT family N-acetyltransferase [Clostridia bacterium]